MVWWRLKEAGNLCQGMKGNIRGWPGTGPDRTVLSPTTQHLRDGNPASLSQGHAARRWHCDRLPPGEHASSRPSLGRITEVMVAISIRLVYRSMDSGCLQPAEKMLCTCRDEHWRLWPLSPCATCALHVWLSSCKGRSDSFATFDRRSHC